MFGGLIRMMLVVVLLVAGAFFLFGYWTSGSLRTAPAATGNENRSLDVDTAAARERGAEIGEKAAVAASRVGDALEEGSLTAKIKAKMVLDDLVKARGIDVTTTGTTVTLSGTVHSETERQRAVSLARETEGVTRVIDQLEVRKI